MSCAAGARGGTGIAGGGGCCVSGGFIAVGGVLLNAFQPFPSAKPPFMPLVCAFDGGAAAAGVAANADESCACASDVVGLMKPPSPKGSAAAGAGVAAAGAGVAAAGG